MNSHPCVLNRFMGTHQRFCVRRCERTFSIEQSSMKQICREGQGDIQRQEAKYEDRLAKSVNRKGLVWLVSVLELPRVEEEVCHHQPI